ncbi:MFS transporter [Streptomyces sp. DSM 15324]|uniref:MFS transporter n=1 Tax=Streptomyces sp. DSM 15324 TaxID=1739111 RepID=UPI00074A30CE|nr:MFS transporter [Streptomyces sp. DSM 15324]KUO07817.1 transporter [Streptomyces sp. DSM 15324]
MPGHTLTRLRIILTAFFALDGFVFAGWVVRIPAIKEQTDATAGTLGLALLGVSAGAVVTMTPTGRLCRRYGSHPVTVVYAVLLCLGVMLPPLTHSAVTLGLALLVFGSAYGGINVAFNSAAVDLVAALRRPIMPTFHAAFSLGGMVGAGLGALVAGALTPTLHLVGLGLIGLAVTAVAGPALLRQAPAAGPSTAITAEPASPGLPQQVRARDTHGGPCAPAGPSDAARMPRATPEPTTPTTLSPPSGRTAASAPLPPGPRLPSRSSATAPRTRRPVLVFGLIALCTAYGEGALADWGALHLRQDLGGSAGAAAIGYSCFALAMTLGRLTGTTLLERLGHTRTVVAGGSLAAAGMLLGALAPTLWAALLGYLIAGLGLANLFPVAVERAGALAGPSGVATASTLGYGGMLLGPPAIGFLAEWLTLSVALTSVAALAALAALTGFATRRAT